MEIIGIALAVLLLIAISATFAALLRDGRGHTPPVRSENDWTALDLPSRNYTLRSF